MAHIYDIEYTDTFGGEANYSWVTRKQVTMPDWDKLPSWDENGRKEPKGYRPMLMRKAKASVGLTGVRGVTTDFGEGYEFRPYRMCTVLFITFRTAE